MHHLTFSQVYVVVNSADKTLEFTAQSSESEVVVKGKEIKSFLVNVEENLIDIGKELHV